MIPGKMMQIPSVNGIKKLLVKPVFAVAVTAFVTIATIQATAARGEDMKGSRGLFPQTLCPVTWKNIDKTTFVDAEGHHIYVCCRRCLAAVEARPAEYIQRLLAKGQKAESLSTTVNSCSIGDCPPPTKVKADVKATKEVVVDGPIISTLGLKVLMDAQVPMTILDARAGSNWDDGRRIPGAKGLNSKAMADDAASVIKSKNDLVVTYCVSVNCPASKLLADRLRQLGYKHVIEDTEGIYGWADANGLPVDQVLVADGGAPKEKIRTDEAASQACLLPPAQARMDYKKITPKGVKAIIKLEKYVRQSGLEPSLLEMVKIRASQINGCDYCLDMHIKDALSHGETDKRIFALSTWRKAPLFSERERAALAWTEAVTRVADTHVPDDVYEALCKQFAEKERVDLTLAIVAINSWNRLNIAFRTVSGSYHRSKN
ncbi:conserved hypothetical protein [Candidatus Brocadia pituitae]|nr:conserved hypothetical protein [Candidatus Brocadia pituitae]